MASSTSMVYAYIYAKEVIIVSVLAVYPVGPALMFITSDAPYAFGARLMVPIQT